MRVVLTEEQRIDQYPASTMETAGAATEEALYSNLSSTRTDKPSGYPYDPYLDPHGKVARVRGDGQKIGPAITLKVMAGDRFNLRVSSWYSAGGEAPLPPNPIADLVSVLATSFAGVSGGKATAAELASTGVLTPGVNSFLSLQTTSTTKPKAYVNWVLFDEQFKYVASSSGAELVGGDGELTTHLRNGLPVEKNGYLYVYVSNETPNLDVFFDNLQVTHTRGPLLEETHYYPFGLTMAGISSKAAGRMENKKGYNGNELQHKEFSDGSGLDFYDFNVRMYDPQLGRFVQVDPLSEEGDQESWSPYHFAYNNPVRFSDPDGKIPILGVLLIPTVAAVATATITYAAHELGKGIQQIRENIENKRMNDQKTVQTTGGTYALKDEDGKVQRTGRTNDLERREKEHARSGKTKDLEFEVDQRTDDKKVQRGREQQLHDKYDPPLNKIKPISNKNPKKGEYMKAAEEHMKKQKKHS